MRLVAGVSEDWQNWHVYFNGKRVLTCVEADDVDMYIIVEDRKGRVRQTGLTQIVVKAYDPVELGRRVYDARRNYAPFFDENPENWRTMPVWETLADNERGRYIAIACALLNTGGTIPPELRPVLEGNPSTAVAQFWERLGTLATDLADSARAEGRFEQTAERDKERDAQITKEARSLIRNYTVKYEKQVLLRFGPDMAVMMTPKQHAAFIDTLEIIAPRLDEHHVVITPDTAFKLAREFVTQEVALGELSFMRLAFGRCENQQEQAGSKKPRRCVNYAGHPGRCNFSVVMSNTVIGVDYSAPDGEQNATIEVTDTTHGEPWQAVRQNPDTGLIEPSDENTGLMISPFMQPEPDERAD